MLLTLFNHSFGDYMRVPTLESLKKQYNMLENGYLLTRFRLEHDHSTDTASVLFFRTYAKRTHHTV